jgi:hypothetical protein
MRIRLIGTGRTTKTAPIERQGGRSRGTPLPSKEFCDTLYLLNYVREKVFLPFLSAAFRPNVLIIP